MKYAYFQRVPKVIVSDKDAILTIVKHAWDKFPSKGVRVFGKAVRISDQDGDNYAKDLVTVLVEGYVYKAPRIVTKQRHRRQWNLRAFRAIQRLYK